MATPSSRTGQPDRVTIASYPTYPAAQRAVDHLSDERFAVENLSIVASDLKLVEVVTGRLSWGRAALGGAGTGAWFGMFVGLLLGLFAANGRAWLTLLLWGVFYGALFGLVFGLVSYALSGGRRDFLSRQSLAAGSYEVTCTAEAADEARRLLAGLEAPADSSSPPRPAG